MGDPPLLGTVQRMVAIVFPATAVTFVGTPGTTAPEVGVTVTLAESAPLPMAFVARTYTV